MKTLTASTIIAGYPSAPTATNFSEILEAQKVYVVECKNYKNTVLNNVKLITDHDEWKTLAMDFQNLSDGKGADAVKASTWVASLKTLFTKTFPKQALVAVKVGVKISGYIVQNVESDEVKKMTSSIMALAIRFPSLFVEGVNENVVKDTLEREEELSMQAVTASKYRRVVAEHLEMSKAELFTLAGKVTTIKEFGLKLPKELVAQVAVVESDIEECQAYLA